MESAFDPKKPGPMKIIADVEDVVYYQHRAVELVYEGKFAQAISVLALALFYDR